jgi:hypothetical protein
MTSKNDKHLVADHEHVVINGERYYHESLVVSLRAEIAHLRLRKSQEEASLLPMPQRSWWAMRA